MRNDHDQDDHQHAEQQHAGPAPRHKTIITSDEPIHVNVTVAGGHWSRIFDAVVESGRWATLSPSGKAVLVVLADAADDGSGGCVASPSISTIMLRAGVGRAATYRAIDELERAGLLLRRTTGGGRYTTIYEILSPARQRRA